ncbi:MAG: SusD/RagB family nutrient-binding outer membrane lipoprotein [Flavobacterium sp.]|nr:SusD/RagB family nutrient-binding outer membrane lipoprotein [Flavobacterium sp.]
MKKIVLLIAFIALSVSCTDDITGLNADTKNPTTAKSEYLFTSAQKALVNQMQSTSVNYNVFRLFAQHWTETTYPDESQYNITTRSIPDTHWTVLYRDVITDLKQAKKLLDAETPGTAAETAILNNKKAIVDIHMAYAYSILVDTFGNIPYSESNNIEEHPLPKYDDAKTIYKDLISRLTADAAALSTSAGSFGAADLVNAGSAAKWKKFANSLRLRLAVNIYDAEPTYAATEIVAAVTAGTIASNTDNIKLAYLGAQPNANPLYVDLVASGRNDFVPANTLVDKMNSLSDPRSPKYFSLNTGATTFSGGIYGAGNTYSNYSKINPTLTAAAYPGTIFDYTEVEFLLAEAAAKGVAVGGTAESHYNAGITASMENWGVASVDIATYLARTDVAYTTATGNYKQKIGEQAWLALYNRGFEAWTSYRRLDFPALAAPAGAYNGITSVPVRFSYPAKEQTLNNTNVTAAITAIGGNALSTKIFWDKF